MNITANPSTAMNLNADAVDRDAQRVAHDTAIAAGRRQPTLLARAARRTWAEIVHQWKVQEYLQHRMLTTYP